MATAWVARHGMTPAQYQSASDEYVGKGFRPIEISGCGSNGQAAYTAIWEKSAGQWAAKHGLTSAQYQTEFEKWTGAGYRLAEISGYTVGGGVRFAAIWQKPAGAPWAARHSLTSAQYQTEFQSFASKGYRILEVNGYPVGNGVRFAAIWEKSSGAPRVAKHNLTAVQYQAEFEKLGGQGYRLVDISGYGVGSEARFAAIWEKSTGRAWVARHNLTPANYQRLMGVYRYQGYRPKWVSSYTVAGKPYYAAIWEHETMTAADLGAIDSKIQAYMAKHSVPGLSFAVTKGERLVFAKGYGMANTATKERVNPSHLFRVASVSKPITAVAVMELMESGNAGLLDRTVFGSGAVLGTDYGTTPYASGVEAITVRHLLEHTGGFTTDGGDPMFMNPEMNQAELIGWVLDNRQLKNMPGTVPEYSNFGYCVLGRVIEKVSGKSYEAWVKEVLAKCGVTRAQIGGRTEAERKPGEVTYYGSNAYSLNPRRMDAHGGWIASPIDLVRFMARNDGFTRKLDVLLPASVQEMFDDSAASPGYALGWIVDGSFRGHNGGMRGTSAFLVSRTDGLAFAVTTNIRASADAGSFELKGVLDDVVVKGKWYDGDLF